MLEIMVAFVVLMVIMAVLYGIIAFSSTLKMQSTDMSNAMKTFFKEVYNENNEDESSKIDVRKIETTIDVENNAKDSLFYLVLDEEMSADAISEDDKNVQISLFQFNAITYSYKDDENLRIKPQSMEFVHKKDWDNE